MNLTLAQKSLLRTCLMTSALAFTGLLVLAEQLNGLFDACASGPAPSARSGRLCSSSICKPRHQAGRSGRHPRRRGCSRRCCSGATIDSRSALVAAAKWWTRSPSASCSSSLHWSRDVDGARVSHGADVAEESCSAISKRDLVHLVERHLRPARRAPRRDAGAATSAAPAASLCTSRRRTRSSASGRR